MNGKALRVLAIRRVFDAVVESLDRESLAFWRGTRAVFGLVQVELPGADIAVSSPRDYGESQHRQYDAGGEKKSVAHVLAPLCRDYTAWGGGEGPCLLAGADFRCRGCGRGRGEVSDEDAEADDSGLHELVEHACCG